MIRFKLTSGNAYCIISKVLELQFCKTFIIKKKCFFENVFLNFRITNSRQFALIVVLILFPFFSWAYTPQTVSASINVSTLNTNDPANCDPTLDGTGILITDATPQTVHDVIIQTGGHLSVSTGHALTGNDLTIEAGGKLCIGNGASIALHDFTVKSNAADLSFSTLLTGTASITASGTIKFIKTINDTRWYFMSFPCDVSVAAITASNPGLGTNWFIREYNGATRANNGGASSNWVAITNGTLSKNKGYIFGSASGDETLTFPLSSDVLTEELVVPVLVNSGSASTNHWGWNLVGQPFLSRFDGSATNISESFLTIWNGSSYDQVSRADALLNPFTAYFVQVGATGNITFNGTGDGRLLVAAAKTESDVNEFTLMISTATGTDHTHIIIDPNQSPTYQIGHDLEKFITTGTDVPQVYSSLNGLNYAFNALPIDNVQNLPIRVYSNSADSATISADLTSAPRIAHLLLTDNTTDITTDLSTTSYRYKTEAGTENARFVITAQDVATSIQSVVLQNKPTLRIQDSKLLVANITEKTTIRIVDSLGRLVQSKKTGHKSVEIQLPAKGIYVVQLQVGVNTWSEKIANH